MKKSNLLLTIIIAFSISAIVLLTLSLIKKNNIFFLPFAVICSSVSVSANGVKQLKDSNKIMGILNVVVAVLLAVIGIADLIIKFTILSRI